MSGLDTLSVVFYFFSFRLEILVMKETEMKEVRSNLNTP